MKKSILIGVSIATVYTGKRHPKKLSQAAWKGIINAECTGI